MTIEEFEKRFGSVHDYVIGVDSDLAKTLTSKNPRVDLHFALTGEEYDNILELFTKTAQES